MTQTTKFFLIYRDENPLSYKDFCKAMSEQQDKVRVFKNRASSEYFSYMMKKRQWHDEYGEWPDDEKLLGDKVRTYLYHLIREEIPDLQTANASTISLNVAKYFKAHEKDIYSGKMAIPSYRDNQPVWFHGNSISVYTEGDGKVRLRLSVFSNDGVAALREKFGDSVKSGRFEFDVWHKCHSSITILERCLDGEYKVCASQLQYNQKKKMWEFILSYSFDAKEHGLDKDRILGIDLGISVPIVVACSDSLRRLYFNGNEIQAFRSKTEAIRRQMLKARVQSGDGSIGHGYCTRTKAVDVIGNRIANFRDTKNNAWSREIVNFAVKNGYGTIQMEDLSGITAGKQSKFLKGWTYFDLQQKITYKAKAEGIDVVLVEPKYTSQRCYCCGYIDKENRQTQEKFECQKCGYTENADYNAARNLSMKGIDVIIKNEREPQVNKKIA